MVTPSTPLVLVTGGSGFVAQHCILQLLAAGYRVRTTIRSLSGQDAVLSALKSDSSATNLERLTFHAADLTSDAGWAEAAASCTYVLHVASPFPLGAPRHEDDLIVPAREGTLRVLRAARDARTVTRVVLTSSFAAVGYGHAPDPERVFTEEDWTDETQPAVAPYIKSKTLAERAAWEFINSPSTNPNGMELSAINPTGVYGPTLSRKYASSLELVYRMLSGGLPLCPDVQFGVVDVRDVADLHVRAMTHPHAKGQRFLATAPPPFLCALDMAAVLRERMGELGRRAPTRLAPSWLLRLGAWFNSDLGLLVGELGRRRQASCEKARRVLGWEPRSSAEALVAAGESLVRFGLVK